MTNETLLSLKGDIFVGIKSNVKCNLKTLVRIKKIIAGICEYDPEYDLNGDGVIDDNDLILCRKILLNKL